MQLYRLMAALAAVSMVFASGCASFNKTRPAPKVASERIQVEYSTGSLSGWSDLPTGVYRVPGSQVIVSGHQSNGAGMLFGLIGVAVESAINSGNGEDRIGGGGNAALRVNLNEQARTITQSLIDSSADGQRYVLTDVAGAGRLRITPAVILSFVNKTDARPYVFLRAELMPTGTSKPIWSTNYVASNGRARTVTGADSWSADNGVALKENLRESLAQAIRVMLADVQHPYPRDPARMQTVSIAYPHLPTLGSFSGYVLGEDENYLYFVPKVGDVVTFSGVNIVDKRVTDYRSSWTAGSAPVVVADAATATPVATVAATTPAPSPTEATDPVPTAQPAASPASPASSAPSQPAAAPEATSQGKWWKQSQQ